MIKELFYFIYVIYANKSQKYNFQMFVVFNIPNNNNNTNNNEQQYKILKNIVFFNRNQLI